MANNPTTIITAKKEKTSILTDVATKGTQAKGAEKKLRGKIQEIMYRVTTNVMPIIIGATGIATKGLKKNLETIQRKRRTDSLQKSYT